MTLELWNTFATFGTFIVIAATAVAALVQLRHMRGGNQIAALQELRQETEAPEFVAGQQLVLREAASKLKDSEFRYQLANASTRTDDNRTLIAGFVKVGNFYESLGLLVKTGLVDRELALDWWASNAAQAWEALGPFARILRRARGPEIWENFEYIVVLAQDWLAAHPRGAYPAGVRRITEKDEWLEADAQYATSRAST